MMLSFAEVRRLLNQVLRTDSDFEAFCIDALPTIHQRFAGQMDRVARVNLIFQHEDPRQVVARLRAAPPEATERALEQPLSLELSTQGGGELLRSEVRCRDPAQKVGAPGQEVRSILALRRLFRVRSKVKKPRDFEAQQHE